MRRRCFGLDVHREFAQVAIWENGVVEQAGQVATTVDELGMFADSLGAGDEVALEATGNSWAVASVLARRGVRVVVSNPYKTRAIAEAKVKTDKIDAAVLAELLAANFLPAVWMPDEGHTCSVGWWCAAPTWSASGPGSRTRSRRCCTAT